MANATTTSTPRIDPPRPPLAGKNTGSFAFYTIRDRLPVILTRVIDDLNKATMALDFEAEPEKLKQGKACIESLSGFRYAMQRDRPIEPLDDDLPDCQAWNDYLALYVDGAGHFQAPWLIQECYMYRRIRSILAASPHWRNYDPFAGEKAASLARSIPVLVTLAAHVQALSDRHLQDHYHGPILTELLMLSLWGNAVDLSLLAGSDTGDTEALGNKMVKEASAGIVINNLDVAVPVLAELTGARVDIVLDNAGFELTADLFLADYLVKSGIARRVTLHAKSYPWFVSDTTPADLDQTLTTLAPHLPEQVAAWRAHLASGAWVVETTPFWTYPHAYHHLLHDLEATTTLRAADYIIFKGDLNYRKLVFDCQWEPTTPFMDAIGPLAEPGALPPFVSLRTCKSDVCVGLSVESANNMAKISDWMTSGKYAVVSYKP
ncbi:hypothetical protein BC828DRAFT_405398 [Blastocladiella britannica]|nr:hypothetical protein BC828DRAFT_405398 [Blastocladiella britannica]